MAEWWLQLGMLTNFLCSVAVVFLNKYIFNIKHFHYGTVLSVAHFLMTWLGLWICAKINYYEVKALNFRELLWLSLAYALSVPFCNLSIEANTVGFYQISKAMVTPVAVIIQYFFYKKAFSHWILMSLLPICIGVSVTGITDVEVTFRGSLYSAACVLSSVLAQIWIQEKQLEYGVNSMQLLYYVVPLSILIQSLAAPIIDDLTFGPKGLPNYVFDKAVVAIIIFSGVVAFFINFTVFFVIRHTSPVSYQVFGHSKTCTIILGGFIFTQQWPELRNLTGIFITLSGVFWYTYLKLQENQEEKKAKEQKRTQV
eukprot:TRINITY_DN4743_c0_g1_i1.p1 TRINITY_DN4743_c0_g1~~TRINITY_DN4743_c0_g1_i1.p1  ORF type:complete len:327 (-),score=45.32 TRINITY_DN4743_c0_g1_i1:503-1438(-)